MPKDISRLSPSFSSAPGCFQEAHRGHRRALAPQPILNVLWGEDAALGSCTEEPPEDTEVGGGDGHPKVTQRLRRALTLPAPTPEQLPILLPGP